MNKIYKVMYSKVKQCAVVVSEIAKSHGHNGESSGVRKQAALTAAVLIALGSLSFTTAFVPMTAEAADKTRTDGSNFVGVERTDGLFEDSDYANHNGQGAHGDDSITIGLKASGGDGTITIGDRRAEKSLGSVYVGRGPGMPTGKVLPSETDDGYWATSVGYQSDATGYGSIAIGSNATANNSYDKDSTGHGIDLKTKSGDGKSFVLKGKPDIQRASVAIGYGASADNGNIAIGSYSDASTDLRTVKDDSAKAYLTGNTADSYVSVGKTGALRRISNVADGAADSDAATIAQLKEAVKETDASKKANIDASNIGKNLKFKADGKTPVESSDITTNENDWGTAIGTGEVKENNGQLVTGGTVYSALENQKKDLSVYAGWGIDIRKNNKNGNLISLQRNLGHIVNVNGESIPKPEVEGYSFILGGEFSNYRSYLDRPFLRNKKWGASGHNSVVVGGFDNLSSGRDSVELGGFLNEANGTYSSVLGGEENITKGSYSTVMGGWDNYAYGNHSTVVGGHGNVAYDDSTVIGGGGNRAGSCFDGTSIRGAIAIGGSGNQAAGSHSVALGGFGANVYASGSTGIAGGSTGFDAYEALAAGYNSTVTVAKGTAIGYTATTNEKGTIAFGHDKGDTYYDGDARYFVGSGSFARWPQKAYRVSQNFYDANGKQITEKEYMALMNPDYTWNDYNERPYFVEHYTSAYYNRLVKVADGINNHDVVVMEQLRNADNVGKNAKNNVVVYKKNTNGTLQVDENGEAIIDVDASKAATKKATEQAIKDSEDAWGSALGTGKVEANNSQLVTGDTVYNAIQNQAEWKLTTNGESADKATAIKPGTTVNFSAEKRKDHSNVTISHNGSNVTIGLDKDIVLGDTSHSSGGSLNVYTDSSDGNNLSNHVSINGSTISVNYPKSNDDKKTPTDTRGVILGVGEEDSKPDGYIAFNNVEGAYTYLHASTDTSDDKKGRLEYVGSDGNKKYIANLDDVSTAVNNAKTKYYAVDENAPLMNLDTYKNAGNDGAKGKGSLAAGFVTHADGIASTVVGSYSGVMNTGTSSGILGHDVRGAAAVSLGTVNVNNNTDTSKPYSGVANSIVGQANMTTNSNAAIIYGAGNTVTDSYRSIDPTKAGAILDNASNPTNLSKAMQDAVKESGGQVMVMGGGNTVDKAYMTQVSGVGNTVTGADSTYAEDTSTQYNFVDGFQNELTNGKHDYIIGSNNTVSGDSVDTNQSNIIFGDNHKLTNQQNNVIIGSSDTADDETTASNIVAIGHNAKVSAEGGVAIGSGSEASTAAGVTGYDPTTTDEKSTDTAAAWTSKKAAVSVGTADETRQIIGVAAGKEETDAVNVAQLKKLNGMKANVNADNIGKNLNHKADGTAVTDEDKTANENDWGAAIGTGSIAADNGQLVTGKTVYAYNKPVAAEGKTLNYVSDTKTTGQNLGSLDAQVGTNTGDISNLKNLSNISSAGETVIKNLAKGSIGMEDGSHTTASHRDVNGVDTYKVDVTVDGQVTENNKGIVDGGTVYNAIQDVKTKTSADLANKANVDASNLSDENVKSWREKLGNGEVVSGNKGLVTGDTVFKAVDTKANRDGSNLTTDEADKFSEKIAVGKVEANDKRAVSGETVSKAISDLTGDMNTKLDGKANTSLDNITDTGKNVIRDLAKGSAKVIDGTNTTVTTVVGKGETPTTYAVNVEGKGTVTSGNTGLISGGTAYTELRPADGSYVKQNSTTAANLTVLDTGLKATSDLIHTNTSHDTIQIGENSTATKIDVSGKDANGKTTGRVITGVVSDANDPNSAANVGYVNGVTAANTQQIYRDMNNAYGRLNNNINKAAAGSNALAALHPLDYDPDDKADFAVGYGHYRNANAAAVGAFYHPNENTMVNVGVSLGNGDPGFNAGVSFKVGRGGAGREAMSKTEMAKVINSQSKEIDALKKDNADKDKRIDALEQKMAEILAKLDKNGK